jgi:hypothetical protein
MALLFKKKLQAQQNYPNFEEAVKQSQITGEGGPPAAMIQKQPNLGKMYERKTGKKAPGLEEGPAGPPTVKTMPSGAAVNVPQSTMKAPTPEMPTNAPDYKMRLEHEQLAGRPLPPHLKEEAELEQYQALSIIERNNPQLAYEIAQQRGLDLINKPENLPEADPGLNARVNTGLKIMEDYQDVKWNELESYVYAAGTLPNLTQKIRRPKEYKPDELAPVMSIEQFKNAYYDAAMAKYPNQPVLGQQAYLIWQDTWLKSNRTEVPPNIVPKVQKPMTPMNAWPTAIDMAKLLGGNPNDLAQGIINDTLPDNIWYEYNMKKARVDDERRYVGLIRSNVAMKRPRDAKALIKQIYINRGMLITQNWLDRVFKRFKLVALESGGFEKYTDPLDILSEVEIGADPRDLPKPDPNAAKNEDWRDKYRINKKYIP